MTIYEKRFIDNYIMNKVFLVFEYVFQFLIVFKERISRKYLYIKRTTIHPIHCINDFSNYKMVHFGISSGILG